MNVLDLGSYLRALPTLRSVSTEADTWNRLRRIDVVTHRGRQIVAMFLVSAQRTVRLDGFVNVELVAVAGNDSADPTTFHFVRIDERWYVGNGDGVDLHAERVRLSISDRIESIKPWRCVGMVGDRVEWQPWELHEPHLRVVS